jgi:Coenzyme PQQ synthesis protein D (PqqD)
MDDDIDAKSADKPRVRRSDLVWRSVAGETIILDLRSSLYLSLNSTAAFLWDRLDGGATQAELVAALGSEYGITPARAEEDVIDFLESCRDRDLLESEE